MSLLDTHYTSCALTVPSDIYVAFAGVVEEIHSRTKDEYFVGFWREGLERQMLWETKNSRTWKPSEYRAPSWTWFSVIGAVVFRWLDPDKSKVLFTVLDVIVHNSTVGLYGLVTYGCLKCRGILGRAVCQWTNDRGWVIQTVHGQKLISMVCRMDYGRDSLEHKVTYKSVARFCLGLCSLASRLGRSYSDCCGRMRRCLSYGNCSRDASWVDAPAYSGTLLALSYKHGIEGIASLIFDVKRHLHYKMSGSTTPSDRSFQKKVARVGPPGSGVGATILPNDLPLAPIPRTDEKTNQEARNKGLRDLSPDESKDSTLLLLGPVRRPPPCARHDSLGVRP